MDTQLQIEGSGYKVWYQADGQTVVCQGSLRLNSMQEYNPISQLLTQVLEYHPGILTLDLQELTFLNSSGINVLCKFVIAVRQQKDVSLVVQASNKIPWQGKSLLNLQKLLPSLQLVLND